MSFKLQYSIYQCSHQGRKLYFELNKTFHSSPAAANSKKTPYNYLLSYWCFLRLLNAQRSCWGGILVSLRPSVRLSVCPSVRPSVRPSRMPCPLCIIFSYGWILFILGTNDHYHERVCRAPWPLTLTYIFKVIWPWLRKSCPLCSVYSSGWILPIFFFSESGNLKFWQIF